MNARLVRRHQLVPQRVQQATQQRQTTATACVGFHMRCLQHGTHEVCNRWQCCRRFRSQASQRYEQACGVREVSHSMALQRQQIPREVACLRGSSWSHSRWSEPAGGAFATLLEGWHHHTQATLAPAPRNIRCWTVQRPPAQPHNNARDAMHTHAATQPHTATHTLAHTHTHTHTLAHTVAHRQTRTNGFNDKRYSTNSAALATE